jgi:hypothetical protein
MGRSFAQTGDGLGMLALDHLSPDALADARGLDLAIVYGIATTRIDSAVAAPSAAVTSNRMLTSFVFGV